MQPPDPANLSRSRGRILLVDDDLDVLETLTELLEEDGFALFHACDAASALAILQQEANIDVLVTDLSMPGDDGLALIRQARAIKAGLPAVLLTGYAEQVISVAAMADGSVHVLPKPVECDRLIEELERLVVRP